MVMAADVAAEEGSGGLVMTRVVPALRIIGIEIRSQDRNTGKVVERGIVPCDVLMPSNRDECEMQHNLTFTFHTDQGDINGQASYGV